MFKQLIVSHEMRRRVSLGIAAVLILPFLFFFHATGQRQAGGPGGSAGTLFGHSIPWETFEAQRLWLKRQWEGQFGELSPSLETMLTGATWDRLMLLEEAKRRRLRVDDQELLAAIEQIPAFQDQGRFQPDRYRRYLQITNADPRAFESLLRQNLLVEKLVAAERNAVTVSAEDVASAYQDAHERIRALLFVFPTGAFTEAVATSLTEEHQRTWFHAHAEEYRVPDQVTIEYVGALREELLPTIQVTDEDLRTYYRDHESDFADEPQRVKPFDEVKDAVRERVADERARKQLTLLGLDLEDDLDAQLRLEEIAAARTLRLHTAGPVPVDALWLPDGPEPAVLQAAASLPDGRLSPVIRTDHGIYVARVAARTPSRLPAYEDVRDAVRRKLIQENAAAAAQAKAEGLRTRLMTQMSGGMRFEEVMLTEGAPAAQTVTFPRTEPIAPIGTAPAVNEAAFRTALGQFTEVLSLPESAAFLRPEARVPAERSELATVETSLREETLTRKQSAHLEAWLQQVRKRAKLKSTLEAVPSEPSS